VIEVGFLGELEVGDSASKYWFRRRSLPSTLRRNKAVSEFAESDVVIHAVVDGMRAGRGCYLLTPNSHSRTAVYTPGGYHGYQVH